MNRSKSKYALTQMKQNNGKLHKPTVNVFVISIQQMLSIYNQSSTLLTPSKTKGVVVTAAELLSDYAVVFNTKNC